MKRIFLSSICALSVLGPVAADTTAAEKIPLWPGQAPQGDGSFEKTGASITVHRPEKANGAAMLICPAAATAVW